jgi:hypothetical protein
VLFGGIAFGQAAAPGQCGYDRWPVKILADKDRARVDLRPVDTTVAQLAAIPIHEIPYPQDRRIEPEELKTFRVEARVEAIRREKDSDIHVIISDPSDSKVRMIVEIPAPECAIGTRHEREYEEARKVVAGVRRGIIVELLGVAFFDFLHEQRGGAPNGIELHPVLSVRLLH